MDWSAFDRHINLFTSEGFAYSDPYSSCSTLRLSTNNNKLAIHVTWFETMIYKIFIGSVYLWSDKLRFDIYIPYAKKSNEQFIWLAGFIWIDIKHEKIKFCKFLPSSKENAVFSSISNLNSKTRQRMSYKDKRRYI